MTHSVTKLALLLRSLQLYDSRGAVDGAFAQDVAAVDSYMREQSRRSVLEHEMALDAIRKMLPVVMAALAAVESDRGYRTEHNTGRYTWGEVQANAIKLGKAVTEYRDQMRAFAPDPKVDPDDR